MLAGTLHDSEILHFASEIGIVLLFFLLGLEFNVSRLQDIAKRIWGAGILDIVLNLGVVMAIAILFGLDWFTAFLIGGVTYATSSSITAKLLDDRSRMANTETEFILALLIFEDLIAPIVVAILIGMSSGDSFAAIDLLVLLGKIVGLGLGAILLGKFVFKGFGTFLDKIDDEDFKIALLIGIALTYGGLALFLGLSEVLGAFLAGIMLSEVGKIERIEHTVLPVKDLMLPLFFVYFGTTVELLNGVPMIMLLIILLVWSMFGKILVGIVGGRVFGLSKRVAFRAGLSICSRGEFSVVIAALAAGTTKVFSGIYIIAAALLGMLFFEKAPQLTNLVYGKPVKKTKSLKVPGN